MSTQPLTEQALIELEREIHKHILHLVNFVSYPVQTHLMGLSDEVRHLIDGYQKMLDAYKKAMEPMKLPAIPEEKKTDWQN
jgi:hypothetical protein